MGVVPHEGYFVALPYSQLRERVGEPVYPAVQFSVGETLVTFHNADLPGKKPRISAKHVSD